MFLLVSMDLKVEQKATLLGALFLIVKIFYVYIFASSQVFIELLLILGFYVL